MEDEAPERPQPPRRPPEPESAEHRPRPAPDPVRRPPGGPPGGGRRQPRSADPGEQRRHRPERRGYIGFGDDLDRAYCADYRYVRPTAWPVESRHGVATRRVTVVARRPNAILLCDGAHAGPHHWPDGDPVPGEPTEAAALAPPPDSGVGTGGEGETGVSDETDGSVPSRHDAEEK